MGQKTAKLIGAENGEYIIFCPACQQMHIVNTIHPLENGSKWDFNGSLDRPTFSPSLMVRWPDPDNEGIFIATCHSVVSDGTISYCADCSHEWRGIHPLPDLTQEQLKNYARHNS